MESDIKRHHSFAHCPWPSVETPQFQTGKYLRFIPKIIQHCPRMPWNLNNKTWLQLKLSILPYGCTTWTLTKRLEKKLDGNYTRMLRAIRNKSWRQHPTRHQLYSHLPPITKTTQVRRTRHAGHCWRSREELISDALLWTPTYGRAKAGRPARTYIQQLCEDTGCGPEDLPEAMNDREKWREKVRDIRDSGTTWWRWYYPKPSQLMVGTILFSDFLSTIFM